MAGCLECLEAETAGFEGALDDLEAVALAQLTVAGDVIRVGVRRQQVCDRQAVPLDSVVERLERRTRVDEDRRAALFVSDEIRVREPAWMHASLDEHRR